MLVSYLILTSSVHWLEFSLGCPYVNKNDDGELEVTLYKAFISQITYMFSCHPIMNGNCTFSFKVYYFFFWFYVASNHISSNANAYVHKVIFSHFDRKEMPLNF